MTPVTYIDSCILLNCDCDFLSIPNVTIKQEEIRPSSSLSWYYVASCLLFQLTAIIIII